MSDATYTARPTNMQLIKDRCKNIKLPKDDNGQYQHDAAVKYTDLIQRETKNMVNLLDRANGMSKLFDTADNHINTIKSTTAYNASDVLKQYKDLAAKKNLATPEITERSDAQDEADRLNQYSQAVIGVKEGIMELFVEEAGNDVMDTILVNADGSNKTIDDYRLSDLVDTIIKSANRPKAPDVLEQTARALRYTYDFRKKVAANYDIQKAQIAKLASYGITIPPPLVAISILANIEPAARQEWGKDFHGALQNIRKKYNYNHVHDDASVQDILTELAAADSVRNLQEAPEPEQEKAHAAEDQDQLTFLQQMLQQQHQEETEYEENAFAAAESDSELSMEVRQKKKKKEKKEERRDRGRSRGRSKSRGRYEAPRNTCKHCKRFRDYARKHDPKKCWFNKAYEGFRSMKICEEIGVKFKPRIEFPEHLGGPRDESGTDTE